MDLYIYADESGVFDNIHNTYFVFAGCVFLFKDDRDVETRKYINVETNIRQSNADLKSGELKASRLSNNLKGKIFRSLNGVLKFAVVIDQRKVQQEIFEHKKSKQRFLDYVFKIGVKRFLESLVGKGVIIPEDVENIHFFVDEHSTATNGKYELREALEEEFIRGTFNWSWNKFYPPIFPSAKAVNLSYCNSSKQALVRASDIVANKVFYHVRNEDIERIRDKVFITYFP
ncbi:DUF3800 domain-containing protein [Aerococcaceae bacterium zg-B36]|uniref:DUF3800 domain-containing protein n=1 Tax=Aerococcaceae bacterium zg-252 TaxID=2796928 RepID=UPI001BD8D819|nr:DUF3800 domain-containing protein [Aerococcaceae bacterium zg-B36]